jgi:hypothetical protein
VLVAGADAVQEAGAPELVIGGRLEPGRLLARTQSGELELPASDLLLVVRGPIRREYQAQPRLRKVTTASLTDGYLFHLHRRSVPAPVELDPEGLEFDDAAGAVASSLLRVAAWVDVIAAGVSVDDAFRFLAPALGTAQEQARARLGAARAIGKRLVESGRDESDRLILDNVRQFRAYSAWRGVAERLRPPR